jgi:hypothetical protein
LTPSPRSSTEDQRDAQIMYDSIGLTEDWSFTGDIR